MFSRKFDDEEICRKHKRVLSEYLRVSRKLGFEKRKEEDREMGNVVIYTKEKFKLEARFQGNLTVILKSVIILKRQLWGRQP